MVQKYYFYYVDFYLKDRLGKLYIVQGHTVASSIKDAKRRIKTEYSVVKFGKVWRSGNMTFDKPKTRGIA